MRYAYIGKYSFSEFSCGVSGVCAQLHVKTGSTAIYMRSDPRKLNWRKNHEEQCLQFLQFHSYSLESFTHRGCHIYNAMPSSRKPFIIFMATSSCWVGFQRTDRHNMTWVWATVSKTYILSCVLIISRRLITRSCDFLFWSWSPDIFVNEWLPIAPGTTPASVESLDDSDKSSASFMFKQRQ